MLELLKNFVSQTGRSEAEFLVTDGRVGCPNAIMNDEDADKCWSCGRLVDVRFDDDGRTWVRCRP